MKEFDFFINLGLYLFSKRIKCIILLQCVVVCAICFYGEGFVMQLSKKV
jgi:hypothetical protein